MKESKKSNNNFQADIHNSPFVRLVKQTERQAHEPSSDDVFVTDCPIEILERRHPNGSGQSSKNLPNSEAKKPAAQAEVIERLVLFYNLSRRQAQVALKCAEGLSNAQISSQLLIQRETVKFHLRNIFIKLHVRRRTELIAYLFRQELTGLIGSG